MSEHAFDQYKRTVYALDQAADQLQKAADLISRVGETLQNNPEALFFTGGDLSELSELTHHWPDAKRIRELLDVFQNAQEAEEQAFNALGYDNNLIQRPSAARQ